VNAARHYHHGDLKNALLEGVAEVIREQGPLALSMREVARRAHVSHAAPAHHYGNKRGLLTALAAQGYERLGACIVDQMQALDARTAAQLLDATGRGYIRFARENPAHFSVMFRVELLDERDPVYLAAADACFGLLMAAVQQGAREGVLGARDPETVAVSAWSLVHGFAALWNDGRLRDRVSERSPDVWGERLCRMFVDCVFDGGRQGADGAADGGAGT
jgi:AcrR family transcriptional regulator